MAIVTKILDIHNIEGANRIELALVRPPITPMPASHKMVVVESGLFALNEMAIYFEPGEFIPHLVAPFLKINFGIHGVDGHLVHPISLMKVVSNGLLLCIETLDCRLPDSAQKIWHEGCDVSSYLGTKLMKTNPN